MPYIAYPDGTPAFKHLWHCTTGGAQQAASRKLGVDWRRRGYRIVTDNDMRHWKQERAKPWPHKQWDRLTAWLRKRWALFKEIQLQQLWGGRPYRAMFGYMVTEAEWRRTHGLD